MRPTGVLTSRSGSSHKAPRDPFRTMEISMPSNLAIAKTLAATSSAPTETAALSPGMKMVILIATPEQSYLTPPFLGACH